MLRHHQVRDGHAAVALWTADTCCSRAKRPVENFDCAHNTFRSSRSGFDHQRRSGGVKAELMTQWQQLAWQKGLRVFIIVPIEARGHQLRTSEKRAQSSFGVHDSAVATSCIRCTPSSTSAVAL